MTDLRALLGDERYDDVIERVRLAIEDELIERRNGRIFVLNANGLTVNERDGSPSGIRRMSTAEAVHMTLAAVLPDLLAAAWDEGHEAGWEDARAVQSTYPEPTPNPYRAEGDPR